MGASMIDLGILQKDPQLVERLKSKDPDFDI